VTPAPGDRAAFPDNGVATNVSHLRTNKRHGRKKILLRPAEPDDALSVARLHTQSWQAAYCDFLPTTYLLEKVPAEHASHWENYMARPTDARGLVMLAEHEGMPVGFVSAENVDDSPHGTLLDCLHVLAAYQGFGAGKLMIDAVRMWTREQNQDLMHLYVLEDNARAIAFYERNGWRFAGTKSSYIDPTPVIDRRYVIDI
jgi:ribosomal protein S18 acetylase RimI-like enzyme